MEKLSTIVVGEETLGKMSVAQVPITRKEGRTTQNPSSMMTTTTDDWETRMVSRGEDRLQEKGRYYYQKNKTIRKQG